MNQSANFADSDQKLSHDLQRVLLADKDELFEIMQESDGEVLLAALRNRSLDENHLLALLKRRGLPGELFTALYNGRRFGDSYPLRFALASHPDTPVHIAGNLLPQLNIFDLIKLCFIPAVPPDQRLCAERIIIQRLPAQPLGNKLTLARRGTATIVEALLREGLPPVVEACLDNPHLKEGAVHQFITSAASHAETISMIARNGRWKNKPNIRLALLKNPRTPVIWFTLLLPGLPPGTLRELLSVPRLTGAQKELVRQALSSRGGRA
ncbi:hypothetical protein F6V25_00990 [Oryzomonas japonica]|uniref:Leucine rich repeat variant n=1 Tax=Oryzomonas japonica TaxID=2603858 RepID=A0A7J4ZUJ2_9BACT|nr:hypothetical protein [Oryzomonas japonica]KAB0667306.1 hypothetical protein F6V25_00990 [Oryzomonas japonica]